MIRTFTSFDEMFCSSAVKAFSFLTEEWNFQFCGISHDELADPRDRRTIVRYRGAQAFVDVALTNIELGLFVYLWPVSSGTPNGPCWGLRQTNVINFDHFLQTKFGDTIAPVFEKLKRPQYLTDMYNQQPGKYAKLMASRLPEAIEATAARFKLFGWEALHDVETHRTR
jgi:hypothetical protein